MHGSVAVAFIALDSKQLLVGMEHVYDHYHHDFGDNNMFPHYLGNNNRKTKDIFDEEDIADDDTIARAELSSLVQFVSKYVLLF